MFPLFFDPTFVLLIPAVILAFWAQMKVKTAYSEYSRVLSRKGISGAQAARAILYQFVMYNVTIQRVAGNLTDHYDPRDRTLHLSEGVFNSTSIAAIGVAAHEVGHAVQHQKNYAPLKFRNAVVPVVGVGSSLAFPLFFLGLLFEVPF